MFGMGTGGSLRLLSPETKQSLDSFAAARSRHPVGHQRPPVCLCSDSRSSRSSVSHSSHVFRTLKTAQARDSASSDQDSSSSLIETLCFLTNHWLRESQVQGSSEPASLTVSRKLFLFPVPFLRSSPRPISIIKLHTLPHFHR